MDRLELKSSAKESIKGHIFEFFKMALVCALISFVLGFIGGLLDGLLGTTYVQEQVVMGQTIKNTAGLFLAISEIATTSLFTFGMLSFFLKLSRNEEVTYKELFNKTNLWLSFITISICCAVFVFLWSLLLIIPGIIAGIAYKMAYYIKLDNPEMGALETIKKSKEIMNGHKWEYFVLQLSFIGWMILGACTLGILYIWLVPYMAVTECNFYNKIKD